MVRVRAFDVGYDTTMVFKEFLSIPTLIGVGVLVGASLPSRQVGFACASILLGKSLLQFVQSKFKDKSKNDPYAVQVGRKTVEIEGDFVVFHIGARCNFPGLDSYFKWQGEARDAMMRELEAAGTQLGYLGGEYFQGSAQQGPMIIQYWRSMEDLNSYARSPTNQHASPWKNLMRKGRETSAYGFWHEAFLVSKGNYECIYANCPPLLLGNCHDTKLVSLQGKPMQQQSAAGRAGRKEFVEYPEDLGKPDY